MASMDSTALTRMGSTGREQDTTKKIRNRTRNSVSETELMNQIAVTDIASYSYRSPWKKGNIPAISVRRAYIPTIHITALCLIFVKGLVRLMHLTTLSFFAFAQAQGLCIYYLHKHKGGGYVNFVNVLLINKGPLVKH
eukprot:sb/3474454/